MIQLIKSKANKDLVLKDNYLYRKNGVYNDKQFWRCLEDFCRATGESSLNYGENLSSFVLKKGHNHAENLEKVSYLKNINDMKAMTRENYMLPVREIIRTTMEGKNIFEIACQGEPLSNQRYLRKIKELTLNPKPYLFKTLKLCSRLCYIIRNERFFRYGPENYNNMVQNDEIILFFSDSLTDILINSEIW